MSPIEKALGKPDFEKRADAFVASVEKKIIPRYPNIKISVSNSTKSTLEKYSFFRNEFWSEHSESDEDLKRKLSALDRVGNKAYQESMRLNEISLIVWADDMESIEQVERAFLDVVSLSVKFHPSEVCRYDDDEYPELADMPTFEGPPYEMIFAEFTFSVEKS